MTPENQEIYDAIPQRVRYVLDEIFQPEGAVIWWSNPNQLLVHYLPEPLLKRSEDDMRPCAHPQAAYELANALADGNF
jgi:hypothetical protein